MYDLSKVPCPLGNTTTTTLSPLLPCETSWSPRRKLKTSASLPTQGAPPHLHLFHTVGISLIHLSGCLKCSGSDPALSLGDARDHLLQSCPITPLEVMEHGLELLAHLSRKHLTSLDYLENLKHNQPMFAARLGREEFGSFQEMRFVLSQGIHL